MGARLLAIFTGLVWLVEILCIPETYAPLLLRKRAECLSSLTNQVYRSKLEVERGKVSFQGAFRTVLSRPWVLLFTEPIVFLLSIYTAIVYGTLYMLFEAFPIVFQEIRGWVEGIGSLPFLAVMTGMMVAVGLNMYDNKRYVRIHKSIMVSRRRRLIYHRLCLELWRFPSDCSDLHGLMDP